MLKARLPALLLLAAGLAGCSDRAPLYIVSHSVVGVNAAVSPQMSSGHLIIGYDRKFSTNPPRSVVDTAKSGEKEAMSVLNCTEVTVEGIFLTSFREHLATGKAAIDLAQNLKGDAEAANKFFECSSTSKSGS